MDARSGKPATIDGVDDSTNDGLDLPEELAFLASNAPIHLGKYEVKSIVAIRGQSTVFAAFDPDLRREVAIKLYHQPLDQIQVERVLSEGRALAQIDSPFVARCYCVDAISQAPFLVIEWISGTTLVEFVKQKTLSDREILRLFTNIVEGINALHEHGLVHRDIKPGNILVTEDGNPKVVDLGLVRPISDVGNEIAGTFAFMAPEVVNN